MLLFGVLPADRAASRVLLYGSGPVLADQGIGHPPDGGGRLRFAGADRGGCARAAPGLRSSCRRVSSTRGPLEVEPSSIPLLGEPSELVSVLVSLTSPCRDRGPRRHRPTPSWSPWSRKCQRHRCEVFVLPRLYEVHSRRRRHGRHRRPAADPAAPVGVPESRVADQARAGRRVFSAGSARAVAAAGRCWPWRCDWRRGQGVIFRQERVGRDGVSFELLKFRSLQAGRRDGVADQLEHLARQPGRAGRPDPAQDLAGRAAPAVQHPAGRHEPGRAAAGAAALRRAVRRALHRLRRPAPGAVRAHRAGPRSTVCGATPRSTSAPGSTTSTSRTGPSGWTSRSSCGPSCPCSPNRARRPNSELGHHKGDSTSYGGKDHAGLDSRTVDYNPADIPVVILCGGMGTRLREASEKLPKPLVDIGGKPILWHIMKTYGTSASGASSCAWATRATRSGATSWTTGEHSERLHPASCGDGRTAAVPRQRGEPRTGRSPSSRPGC